MEISPLLRIPRGVTAIIGGGGKTTLLHTLAEELCARGRVIVCTSTHIRRPKGIPTVTEPDADALRQALQEHPVVCAGTPAEDGKLTAPGLSFDAMAELADYVIAEADGSKGLPLKAHAPHEPVIPENAGRVVLVIGADGLGRPIREACHRPELFAARAGVSAEAAASPEVCARVIEAEGFGDIVFCNKAETDAGIRMAEKLARLLPRPLIAGSLHRREYLCLR